MYIYILGVDFEGTNLPRTEAYSITLLDSMLLVVGKTCLLI